MASTILDENGWPVNAIERQLAYVECNSTGVANNHTEYLGHPRLDMMQWWADWPVEVKYGCR